jgi:hypothetical protein
MISCANRLLQGVRKLAMQNAWHQAWGSLENFSAISGRIGKKNIDNLAIRFYFSHELGETVRKMG